MSTVSTTKKYLCGGQVVSPGSPCGQRRQAAPPRPSPPLPYDEVKVGTSKHEQTQQCGDGPIGHWSKCAL